MEERKILITTKTYPAISQTYREIVCTAGILLDDNEQPVDWIRIYPIRFRYLEQKYKRWSIIRVKIEKNNKDPRPESYKADPSSIEVLREIGTKNCWKERKSLVLPLQLRSVQDIQEQGRSLGIIKPKSILKFFYKEGEREWTAAQQAILAEQGLFEKTLGLEKMPYDFGYQFIDEDDKKHNCTIIDWEIFQLYRNCRDNKKLAHLSRQEREMEAIEKVRQKYEATFLSKNDLYFIMGNQQLHPKSFMIIGVFYPLISEDKTSYETRLKPIYPTPKPPPAPEPEAQQLNLLDLINNENQKEN